MSLYEPGNPLAALPKGHETTAGLVRVFPITQNSPHEPWCLHFEWGPCTCGPRPGEVFVETGTADVPGRQGGERD